MCDNLHDSTICDNASHELIDIKLYPIENKLTPYVLTIYFSKLQGLSETAETLRIWNIIKSILDSNNLDLTSVLILYYRDHVNTLHEIHQWHFDVYSGKYVGDTIDIIPIIDVPIEVQNIHKRMLKHLNIKAIGCEAIE
ncbi:hypothetical protein [Bacillus subtilis]|uniref:hypothetical protein n=1 Tax=Bacillus subtilis TaxID=1423 RepID=UPI001B926C4D|nr:hypothetical protein [Bacillus subtilis]CAI6330891.1 hypothetical protein NRS6096_22165 [Bacillus subtilis]